MCINMDETCKFKFILCTLIQGNYVGLICVTEMNYWNVKIKWTSHSHISVIYKDYEENIIWLIITCVDGCVMKSLFDHFTKNISRCKSDNKSNTRHFRWIVFGNSSKIFWKKPFNSYGLKGVTLYYYVNTCLKNLPQNMSCLKI